MSTFRRASQCERAQQMAWEGDLGDGSVDSESYERHLQECERCRHVLSIMGGLRFDGAAGASAPLDDVRRQQWVNRIVAECQHDARDEVKPHRRFPAGRAAIVAGLAACLLVAVGGLLWQWLGPACSLRIKVLPEPGQATLLLRAAGAAVADDEPTPPQAPLVPGSSIQTGHGQVVVSLPLGSKVGVDAYSKLTVEKLSSDEVVLRLNYGRLLAKVTRRQGQQRFRVNTPLGQVSVTGTVFRLGIENEKLALQVFRGQVSVTRPPGTSQQIHAGQQMDLDRQGSRTSRLSPAAGQQIEQDLRLLALLTAIQPVMLQIDSRPSALVQVNGVSIGHTPVVALVRQGTCYLSLSRPGYAKIGETVAPGSGPHVKRMYELMPSSRHSLLDRQRQRSADVATIPPLASRGHRVVAPMTPRMIRRRPAARTPRSASPPTPLTPKALTPPTPIAPSPAGPAVLTARHLLRRAQQRRAAGQWKSALDTYRKLRRRFPRSAEASAAIVSIGYILLDPLKNPAGALGAFNRYLTFRRHGTLAQEAAYGRIRALRALGRGKQEIAALKRFLLRFPRALQVRHVRRRLQLLSRGKK